MLLYPAFFPAHKDSSQRRKSSSAIHHFDVMSEVEDILNNLPRDEQSRRRVWEWIQSQNDDKSEEQESERPHAGRKSKDPPDPDRSGEEESQSLAHGASDEQGSVSNGEEVPARAESPRLANPGDSPLPPGSTAAPGGPPRRGRSVSEGSSAALGRPTHKGKSPMGKPRHSKGGLCSLASTMILINVDLMTT